MAYTSPSDSGWQFRSFARPITKLTAQLQLRWRQHQTEKMLESLPSEIRKDIGWPTSDDTDAASRLTH